MTRINLLLLLGSTLGASLAVAAADKARDFSPNADEKQVPHAMHSGMKDRPNITVGQRDADIIGTDNRVLQAAVDYVAALGGGVVEIGEGEYLMSDCLL